MTEYIVLRSQSFGNLSGTEAAKLLMRGDPLPDFIDSQLVYTIESVEADSTRSLDLQSDPGVLAVAQNTPLKLIEPLQGEEPLAPLQDEDNWGLDAIGDHGENQQGRGSSIAILDTGIDQSHEAFRHIKSWEVQDFTREGNGDRHGHGTHCAGTAFGRDVGGIRIGVARGVETAIIGKVLDRRGRGSTDSLAKAMRWAAEKGATVISMSLGFDFPGYAADLQAKGYQEPEAFSIALTEYRNTVELFELLAQLIKNQSQSNSGPLIVAASGNESRRGNITPFTVNAAPPAVAKGIRSVGALQSAAAPDRWEVAPFSNAEVDYCAPGVDIISAKVGGGLTTMSGTSMATPHAAGVAAVWASHLDSLGQFSNSLLDSYIMTHATMQGIVPNTPKTLVGTGIVQLP